MPWEFDSNRPIYIQLIDELKLRIISGIMPIGSKLDSVRDLSEAAGVNPNTMQRALSELERENLVFSKRTSGRYVTDDTELIRQIRKDFAQDKIREFTNTLLQLGYEKQELIDLITAFLREEN